MAVALLGCLWLATTIQVRADGNCPTASDVERKLGPLLADASGDGPVRRATIVEERGGLSIRLEELDGAAIAEKRLPVDAGASCAALAETAAVVVATWDARLRSGISLIIDSPIRPTSPKPSPVQAPAPTVLAATPPPLSGVPRRFDTSVFAALYLDTAAVGPAAKAGLRLGGANGLGAQVSIGTSGPYHSALANGQTRWGRFALGLGPSLGLGTGAWRLRLAAEGTLGLLVADGVGYDVTQRRLGMDVGGTFGVSVGRRFGRVMPYLGGELWGWARNHALTVAGTTEVTRPPRGQVWVGAGVAWGLDP